MTEKSGLPLREVGVACSNCGSTKRRPESNRCAGCGRYAEDPIYAKSELTDSWYRVWEYERKDGENIIAKSKTEVSKEEVPDQWVDRIENNDTQ